MQLIFLGGSFCRDKHSSKKKTTRENLINMYIFTKETEKMNYLLDVFEVYFLESFNYRLSKIDITYWCIL